MLDAVKSGIRYLDEKRPGWANRIDVSRLNIADDNRCIIGQLEGSFNRTHSALGLTLLDAQGLGLFVPGPRASNEVLEQYAVLTADWREEIFRRREETAREAAAQSLECAEEPEEELACV